MKTTLIQIVSEQQIPNILGALSIQPDTIIHLVSNSKMAKQSAENLEKSFKEAAINAPVTQYILPSEIPSIQECYNAINDIYDNHATNNKLYINFTNGTKLMSIGVYMAATKHQIPSFYVESAKRQFIDGETGTLTYVKEPFTTPISSLNTYILGYGQGSLTCEKDWKDYVSLAHKCQQSFFNYSIPSFKNGYEYRQALEKNHCWFQKCLDVQKEATKLSMIKEGATGGHFTFPFTQKEFDNTPCKKIQNNMEWITKFFISGWWEIIVTEALAKAVDCKEIKWSCVVPHPSRISEFEEDILAISNDKFICVSCKQKSNKEQLLSELNKLHDRTIKLGGNQSISILAVREFNNPENEKQVAQQANNSGIILITEKTLPNLRAMLLSRGCSLT